MVVYISTEKRIWDYLKAAGLNDYGSAGLMGNLYAESGLSPTNLQNSYEKKLGYTDEDYTAAVDNGIYTNFVKDSAGYGLAQWTYWSRKQALLAFCKAAGASIGDLDTQLAFLMKELSEGYRGVLEVLKTASSVVEASNAVLLQFERPADQSTSVQSKRASYGQVYYSKYSNGKGDDVSMSNSSLATYTNISPNKNSPRNHAIDRITIHCFVGQVTAKRGCDAFKPSSKKASCNYVVGYDGSIGLCVDEKDRSWCSSSSANDNRAVTIETASDNYEPYAVTDKAYSALIDLVTDICRRNGKTSLLWFGDKDTALAYTPAAHEMVMTVHRWFANKSCPGNYLYERHGEIAAEVNRRLSEEDDDMDVNRFGELWNELRKTLQDNDASSYSETARKWATDIGLIAGNGTTINGEPNYMWADMLTREQLVTVLYRFAQLIGKA
ncbi:phage tail tip lysozyme [Flavonifractor plautii]|uniref:phage tail tip lysozyme n=1 Tax=Flavonifractor plautii TaxID=292800 RepID=UPI0030B9ADD6